MAYAWYYAYAPCANAVVCESVDERVRVDGLLIVSVCVTVLFLLWCQWLAKRQMSWVAFHFSGTCLCFLGVFGEINKAFNRSLTQKHIKSQALQPYSPPPLTYTHTLTLFLVVFFFYIDIYLLNVLVAPFIVIIIVAVEFFLFAWWSSFFFFFGLLLFFCLVGTASGGGAAAAAIAIAAAVACLSRSTKLQ